ncbi:hypothetical protein [Aquibium microcysteis]|uniref:hypothetical protein n=1 Tax=Aquibium microcysteis TaxID=675281 RepID=UPI00165D02C1|nr:hypothetical protein [Aquibium microcysteis]
MIKRGMTITWTNQGAPAEMYYSACLFRRDRRCIMDMITSESLVDLKRAIRATRGGLRPGRLILVDRHCVNMGKPKTGWLRWRKRTFSKPYILSPDFRRARRIWPAT